MFWKCATNLQENTHAEVGFQYTILSEHIFLRTPPDGCRSVQCFSIYNWKNMSDIKIKDPTRIGLKSLQHRQRYKNLPVVNGSPKTIKGTLLQIWKSANIFVFTWKYNGFTLTHILRFHINTYFTFSEIFSREIFEKFICKHSETEYV